MGSGCLSINEHGIFVPRLDEICGLEARELKEILLNRSRLVRDATRMKNRIHMLLLKNNHQSPFSDLFGFQGLSYLKQIDLPDYHPWHREDNGHVHSYRNLASYAGLFPSLDASAGKEKKGRITQQGSVYLRTALVEAAQAVLRMNNCRLDIVSVEESSSRAIKRPLWPQPIRCWHTPSTL